MKGKVINIQNFSVNDGNGIRTNIFFAGCPLRCAWCANPEGQDFENSFVKEVSEEEIYAIIDRQKLFYRFSGGGITFSGGECTVQLEFLRQLTDRFYDQGYDLAIETCGYFDFEKVKGVLSKMNLIFMDLKIFNSEVHKKYTGVAVELIKENIKKTAQLSKSSDSRFIIRVPVIEGVNADEKNMEFTADFINTNAPEAELELLPYHRFGEEKYLKLQKPLPPEYFKIPNHAALEKLKSIAVKKNIRTVDFK